MPKSKSQKTADLAELTSKLKSAKGVVMAEYRGTTVKDMDKVRRALKKENVFAKVYKISLLRKALAENGFVGKEVDYKVPVILSISTDDETSAARLIKILGKEIKTLNVLEGIVDKNFVTKAQVLALADLPSKQDLRGMLVRTINAPVSGFVNVLAGSVRSLLNVLNAMAQKA